MTARPSRFALIVVVAAATACSVHTAPTPDDGRPQPCPKSVIRAVDGGDPGADALPPIEAASTSRRVADAVRARVAKVYGQTRVAVGPGYGRAWKGENGGHYDVIDIEDFGVLVTLADLESCPTGASVHVWSEEGVPIFFFYDSD